MLNINCLITLEDLSTNDLLHLLQEAKSKLQKEELSTRDKKVFTLRVFLIRSILKERQAEALENVEAMANVIKI